MGKRKGLTPEERAHWAERQRAHMRSLGVEPRPPPDDPSPLLDVETYALWAADKYRGPPASEAELRKKVSESLAKLTEEVEPVWTK